MTAPVTRRGLLGRAVAAGAVGLAAVPVALAHPVEAAVDPLIAMFAERERMRAASDKVALAYERSRDVIKAGGSFPDQDALDQQLDEMYAAEDAVDDRIVASPATSIAGIIVQARILEPFVNGQWAGSILAVIIEGLEAMQANGDRPDGWLAASRNAVEALR